MTKILAAHESQGKIVLSRINGCVSRAKNVSLGVLEGSDLEKNDCYDEQLGPD